MPQRTATKDKESVKTSSGASPALISSTQTVIPVQDIRIEDRERMYHPEHVEELKINIEDIGLINPITVSVAEDGTYTLIAGRHRLEAYRSLADEGKPAYAQIPVVVMDAADAKRIELCENLYRNDLPVLEKAEHLMAYLKASSDTVSELLDGLAKQAKQSKRTFYRFKAIGSGIQVADEIKKLPTEQAQELMNSTRQLYFLATKCSKDEQQAIMSLLKKNPELSVHQAVASLQEKPAEKVEKLISVRLPKSLGEQLASLSEKREMQQNEFTERFVIAALAAFEQGAFQL